MPTIGTETPDDHDVITAVVTAAFESDVEAIPVDRIRASELFIPELSLVAEEGGESPRGSP